MKSAATVECNGPRDCIGTERGCSHCDPKKFKADRFAATKHARIRLWLNAAANRHGSDHELSAVCSHLHSELPKLAAERDRYKAALELIAGGEYADAAENVAGDVLSRV